LEQNLKHFNLGTDPKEKKNFENLKKQEAQKKVFNNLKDFSPDEKEA
jgi:hypothetical protein